MIYSFQDAFLRKRLSELESVRTQMKAQALLLLEAGEGDLVCGLLEILASLDEQIRAWKAPGHPHIP